MSRFNINSKYLFVSFLFEMPNGTKLYSRSPSKPCTQQGYTKIDIVELECFEERDVPVEYTEGQTTKGYLFRKGNESIWYNQYPYAEYGQVSTVADHIAHESHGALNEETKEQEFREYISIERALGEIQSYLRNARNAKDEYAQTAKAELTKLARSAGYIVYIVPLMEGDFPNWEFAKIKVSKPEDMAHTFTLYETEDRTEEELAAALAKIGLTHTQVRKDNGKNPWLNRESKTRIAYPDKVRVTVGQLEAIPESRTVLDKKAHVQEA